MSKVENVEADKSDKDDKSGKDDKRLFVQRAVAFIIDITLISFISSVIAAPFLDGDGVMKLSDSLLDVMGKYTVGEINYAVYIAESIPLTFQMARKTGIITLVSLFLSVLYFIVYQFNKGGQTFGKKLMKIKVVSIKGQMTMNQMLVRSLIINSILIDMIVLGLTIFASQDVYFYGSMVFEQVQSLILILSVAMVLFSRRGRGLHDMISRCEVIREK